MSALISLPDVRTRIWNAVGLQNTGGDASRHPLICALLRRAASLRAPCTSTVLSSVVYQGLRGIWQDDEALRIEIDSAIEALIGYGDLFDLADPTEPTLRSNIFIAPPSFVQTAPGKVFLLGVPPDGQDILPASLSSRIINREHTRSIEFDTSEDLPLVLMQLGLHSLSESLWLKHPRIETPQAFKENHDRKLDATTSSGDVADLTVIHSGKPVTYYRGRWVLPSGLTGRFVGRRQQRYGAALWCYVELDQGEPTKLLDLLSSNWRGCDLAWQLQLALDALAGTPQQFSADLIGTDEVVVRIFSPLPGWWRRRWDVLGRPVEVPDCLFAYVLPYSQFEQDLPRMRDELWIDERK